MTTLYDDTDCDNDDDIGVKYSNDGKDGNDGNDKNNDIVNHGSNADYIENAGRSSKKARIDRGAGRPAQYSVNKMVKG